MPLGELFCNFPYILISDICCAVLALRSCISRVFAPAANFFPMPHAGQLNDTLYMSSSLRPKAMFIMYFIIYTLFNDVFNISDTLMQDHGLRSFQNRTLRKIFRPKKEKLKGGWRRLLNEELHDLYCSLLLTKYYWGDKIRNVQIGETCGT